MNNTIKKLVILLLALACCVGSLTGCISSFAAEGDVKEDTPDVTDGETPTLEAPAQTYDRSYLRIGVWDYNQAISTTERGALSLVEFGADTVMHPAASFTSTTREDQYTWFTKYNIDTFGVKHNLPYSTLSKLTAEIIAAYKSGSYENLADGFDYSDCEVGDYLYDEVAPKKDSFLLLRRIVQKYEEQLPGRFPLINLNPCYWGDGQGFGMGLDFDSYSDYIEMYCRMFPTLDCICYDIYPFYNYGPNWSTPLHPYYLKTLDTAAAACRKYGKDHWIIFQAGSNTTEHPVTDTQLRLQVFTSLAYGTTSLIYANYTRSWWAQGTSLWTSTGKNEGDKTYLWDLGKVINGEVRTFSDQFMRYESIDVCAVGTAADASMDLQLKEQNATAAKRGFTAEDIEGLLDVTATGGVLIGNFAEKNNGTGRAAMIVNVTDPFDESEAATVTVSFRVEAGKKVTVYTGGTASEPEATDGVYTVTLTSGNGAFVTVE